MSTLVFISFNTPHMQSTTHTHGQDLTLEFVTQCQHAQKMSMAPHGPTLFKDSQSRSNNLKEKAVSLHPFIVSSSL